MKAVIQQKYGSAETLELREIDKPTIGDDGVLVRVRAASVNPADWRPVAGKPYSGRVLFRMGVRAPKQKLRGVDVAGVVEAVGKDVTSFKPGDEVFGARSGAFAEYLAGVEKNFAPKPAAISFEEAAAIPIAGCTALQAVRDHGRLEAGQNVLINGASGGVGTFAVQIAKELGAHVTGVCSTRNIELVRSLGADEVVDYTREDFTRRGRRYDVVVDNVGNHSLRALRRVLSPKGALVIVGAPVSDWLVRVLANPTKTILLSRFVDQRLVFFIAKLRNADLVTLAELAAAGKVKPVIDRTYPLSEVAEAIRYCETLHARAKVVITVPGDR